MPETPSEIRAETPGHTLLVAALVCLVCSVLVSGTAVLLRPIRDAHLARERNAYILTVLESIPGLAAEVGEIDAADLEARVIDLETGELVPDVDPSEWDALGAAADPEQSVALPDARDPAGLGRREHWATVYVLRDPGDLERVRLVVLPVRGQGFQSMVHGYLALDADLSTVLGLTFYQQKETPGLGALITDPSWLAQWHGKRARDDSGALRLKVAHGPAAPGAVHEVDGISGATWTGDGVTNLLRFWLGDDGYGPFLRRLASP
jgi:Na+-transporting NADH:ubiquinone oxidoreductase subunit C